MKFKGFFLIHIFPRSMSHLKSLALVFSYPIIFFQDLIHYFF